MAAGDVHRELTVAGEPFCGLLGMTVREGESFCSGECPAFVNTWAYTYILHSCVSPVRRVLFVCTHTLNLSIHPNVDTNEALIIYEYVVDYYTLHCFSVIAKSRKNVLVCNLCH